ncbi:MAG TPA: hypothetical protein VL025_14860 [Thermoanaerobaculia bacterium]|nr:hypothetical protein [Thermoanaerobaculia bacterium]
MNDHEILRRFLLGDLDAGQTDELEQRLLEEEDLFDLAEAVEADLLDAAARGTLSSAERGRVLRRLAASPEGRARLALARGLTSLSRDKAPAEVLAFRLLARPWVRAAAVAASLLVVPAGLWLGMQTLEPGGAMACLDCGSSSAPLVLQLALTGVRSASDGPSPLIIPPRARSVDIRLTLGPDDPSTSFAAVLRNTGSGQEIQREQLAAKKVDGGRALVLSVPAAKLEPGTYEVEVRIPTSEGDELFGKPTFEVASTNHPSRPRGGGIP